MMISDEELNEQIEYLQSFSIEFQDVIILLRELVERRKSPQYPNNVVVNTVPADTEKLVREFHGYKMGNEDEKK